MIYLNLFKDTKDFFAAPLKDFKCISWNINRFILIYISWALKHGNNLESGLFNVIDQLSHNIMFIFISLPNVKQSRESDFNNK